MSRLDVIDQFVRNTWSDAARKAAAQARKDHTHAKLLGAKADKTEKKLETDYPEGPEHVPHAKIQELADHHAAAHEAYQKVYSNTEFKGDVGHVESQMARHHTAAGAAQADADRRKKLEAYHEGFDHRPNSMIPEDFYTHARGDIE